MPTSDLEPDVVSALETVVVGEDAVLRYGEPRPATVAVCIPVRNAEATLDRCLDSVLGQEGVDLRVVVVDNASTDGTLARVTARAARDPRLVFYRNPRDVGRVGNWNRCLDLVGDCAYAKLLMASDELLPGFLAQTVAALEAHPDAVLLRASLSFRHADGTVEFLPHFPDSRVLTGEDARRACLTEGNLVANPSGQLWRTGALAGLRFDESLSWAADYDFALSLLRRGDFVYLREQLYLFDLGANRHHNAAGGEERLADEQAVLLRHGGAAPALELRGVSFLLPLDDGWEETVREYVASFRPEDDVTLVLKPQPGADPDVAVAAVSAEVGEIETADVLFEPSLAPVDLLAPQVSAVVAPGARLAPLFRVLRPRVPQAASPRVHVVMPIGVGAPGAPVPAFLRTSLESLARQTFRDFHVTVAADENIAPEARAIVESFGAELVWWPKDTYFAKGGIWKKITDGWQAVDSEYVAYFHYDDLWDERKLEQQLAFVESRGLDGCWTSAFVIDETGAVRSGDMAPGRLEDVPPGAGPGPCMHSTLVSRRAILDSGILAYEERWAAIFERLYFLYLRKIGNLAKCTSARFCYREHAATITNTAAESAAFVVAGRATTAYTLAETLADAESIDLDTLAARLVADAA